jgi:hypothetical protein
LAYEKVFEYNWQLPLYTFTKLPPRGLNGTPAMVHKVLRKDEKVSQPSMWYYPVCDLRWRESALHPIVTHALPTAPTHWRIFFRIIWRAC